MLSGQYSFALIEENGKRLPLPLQEALERVGLSSDGSGATPTPNPTPTNTPTPTPRATPQLRPRWKPSSSGNQPGPRGQQRPQAQPQASGSKRGDSCGKRHQTTLPMSPTTPAAATSQKRVKVEEEDWAEYAVGLDLGSTFTRAAFYKYNDNSSGAIPLEEGDSNSMQKETAIYITDAGLGPALIGQSAVYRHSHDMRVAMHKVMYGTI